MKPYIALALIICLFGCGVDVATSTATVAKSKTEEVKQAQKTKKHLTSQVDAAMAAGQQRLRDADQAIE